MLQIAQQTYLIVELAWFEGVNQMWIDRLDCEDCAEQLWRTNEQVCIGVLQSSACANPLPIHYYSYVDEPQRVGVYENSAFIYDRFIWLVTDSVVTSK